VVIKKEGKMPDMTFNYYYDTGELYKAVIYQNNQIIEVKEYTQKGVLTSDLNIYKKYDKTYTPEGRLNYEFTGDIDYEKDTKKGVDKIYYDDTGELKYKYYRENYHVIGEYLGYHKNGKIWVKGFYKNGKRHGKFYIYYENNKYPIIIKYKNGQIIRKKFSASMKRRARKIIAKPSSANLTPKEETIYREWSIYNTGIFQIDLDEETQAVIKRLRGQKDQAVVNRARKKYSEFLNIKRYDFYRLKQLMDGWAFFFHTSDIESPVIAVRKKTIKTGLKRREKLRNICEYLGYIKSKKIKDKQGFPRTVEFYDALPVLQDATYIE